MPRAPEASHHRPGFASQALAHADALHNLARHLMKSQADAEDLVQETYVRAFAAAGQLEAPASLKAWLFKILRNAFVSRLRHARHDPTEGGLDSDPPEVESERATPLRGDVELEAMRGIVAGEIAAAVRALHEESRTIVLLDLEGFSEAEMASILGCAQGTVKSRLSRARAALREQLADYARPERP